MQCEDWHQRFICISLSFIKDILYYFTYQFQALQLIALAVFGAVDQPLASCMLVHFSEI